jgi:hypothetical protein
MLRPKLSMEHTKVLAEVSWGLTGLDTSTDEGIERLGNLFREEQLLDPP